MIERKDIVAVLQRYTNRYRYLNVLSADVRADAASALPNGVVRFSSAHAAVGASISEEDGGVLTGMLLGVLVGAVAGDAPQMNRVRVLRFEPHERRWNVYDGPMLNLAKTRLIPGV